MNTVFLCIQALTLVHILQINNAGVNFNVGSDNSLENAEKVIDTNYYGTKNVIKAMIPLMKASASGARIVNVTSRLGRINGRRNVSNNLAFLSLVLSQIWLVMCA